MIPVVIVHLGNQSYLHDTVTYVKSYGNRVIILGDESNKHIQAEHFMLSTLRTSDLDTFEQSFVNYSTNNAGLERFCFSRLFYIREWMKQHSIDTIVHLDSDCILLEKTDKLFDGSLAYTYNVSESSDPEKMAGSIATSCLTMDFLNKFVQLCFDIYVTKTKHNLIEPKIKYHRQYNKPGGICDMTLYYILTKEMNVKNLLDIQPDGSTYDDNITDTLGFDGMNTFEKIQDIKYLHINDDGIVYAKCTNGRFIKLNNLHFQGSAKGLLHDIANILLHRRLNKNPHPL